MNGGAYELIIEDSAPLLDDEAPLIIPLTLSETAGGKITVTAYPEALDAAKKHMERVAGGDIFGAAALKRLSAELSVIAASLGYEPDRPRVDVVYRADNADRINRSAVLPDTVVTTEPSKYKNPTAYRPDDGEPCAIILRDGVIASIASVNSYPEGSKIRELNVQTTPKYRKRGFAVSCVAALSLYLFKNGAETLKYECRRSNTGSIKTAERAGFIQAERVYYYLAYR